ncbi:MAG: tRNA lysidine(34) synthetase TilS [Rhodobacteraceae bacterium]|nr:tRNA lysidine(34) synthetase TilS [Paracoccaceae bacterium]
MIPLCPLPDGPLGVAVSGGGDSVALLMLLHEAGHKLYAATVDHGLRPEAAAEAQGVAVLCARIGVPHEILLWQRGDKSGNLQMAAREARLMLLGAWAKRHGLEHIALGHTLDDQAETVLMRLARGSGIDGLAGMAPRRCAGGLCWHRPLLGVRRADLRVYLRENSISWVDDPSNDDTAFDRIKARRVLEGQGSFELDPVRLAQTADHMRDAREVLDEAAHRLARECININPAGELALALPPFSAAARETRARLLAAALVWVGNARYRPRFTALESILTLCLAQAPFARTLHGCTIRRHKDKVLINREVAATPPAAPVAAIWDGRWEITEKPPKTLTIRALGEDGLQLCPEWRDSGYSRVALLPSPSFWREDQLISAPLAGFGPKFGVKLACGAKGFYDALNTH